MTEHTLATWRLDNAAVDAGTFCLIDAENPAQWLACEHPVSIRNFAGLRSGLGFS